MLDADEYNELICLREENKLFKEVLDIKEGSTAQITDITQRRDIFLAGAIEAENGYKRKIEQIDNQHTVIVNGLKAENAKLERQLKVYKKMRDNKESYCKRYHAFCMDCYDKLQPNTCLRCENQRLESKCNREYNKALKDVGKYLYVDPKIFSNDADKEIYCNLMSRIDLLKRIE